MTLLKWMIVAVAFLAACSRGPETTAVEASTASATSTVSTEVSAATIESEITTLATQVISHDLGEPVQVRIEALRHQDDWVFVKVLPLTPSGQDIDLSTTHYASADAEGMVDGNDTYLLLHHVQGVGWRMVQYVLGPTDVPWGEWPDQYGFSPSLLDLYSSEQAH